MVSFSTPEDKRGGSFIGNKQRNGWAVPSSINGPGGQTSTPENVCVPEKERGSKYSYNEKSCPNVPNCSILTFLMKCGPL